MFTFRSSIVRNKMIFWSIDRKIAYAMCRFVPDLIKTFNRPVPHAWDTSTAQWNNVRICDRWWIRCPRKRSFHDSQIGLPCQKRDVPSWHERISCHMAMQDVRFSLHYYLGIYLWYDPSLTLRSRVQKDHPQTQRRSMILESPSQKSQSQSQKSQPEQVGKRSPLWWRTLTRYLVNRQNSFLGFDGLRRWFWHQFCDLGSFTELGISPSMAQALDHQQP